MTTTVENLKNEISDCYIKDLKKQLWWFKSIAVLPIQKPIKDILVWKGELPEKFDEVKEFWWRKDIINFVSPQVANEIFEFMKNKRIEIEKRKTEAELLQLKNEILWLEPETSSSTQNPESWTPWSTWAQESDESGWDSDAWNWGSNDWEWSGDGAEDSDSGNDETHEWSESQETENSGRQNWVVAWVETAVIWWAWTLALERAAARNAKATEQMMEQLNAEKMKSTIESVIDAAKKRVVATGYRMTEKQTKTVEKYIKRLEEGIKGFDWEAVDVIKERNKLWNKFNISRALLENCGLSAGDLSKISRIANDLVWKSEDEIKVALKAQNITSVDDSIIKAFSKASTPDELVAMTKILKHWNRVPRLLQTLAGALWMDAAFTWLDVWMYIEQKKEAELISKVNELRWKNKRNQAWRQLWIWLSSVAIEALWILALYAATWSAWWLIGAAIWVAVWALTMAASFGVDSLYFDVKDFYLQNQEDFLRQTRAQLKQAILQWIHNKKEWNWSQNEHITSFFSPSMKPGSDLKEKSLNDACVSMIFLEEIDTWGQFAYNELLSEYIRSWKSKEDFLSDKDQNYKNTFEEAWKNMEIRCNLRMQYVLEEFKKSDIIDAINSWEWMQYLTTIFTNSRTYAELKELWKWDDSKTFRENTNNYKSELLSEFSAEKVHKFEALRESNPSLFMEIINTVSLSGFIYWEEDEEKNEDDNYVQNVKMVVAYKKILKLNESVENKRYLYIENSSNCKFIENLLKSDFDLDKVEYPTQNPELIIAEVSCNAERYWLTDISDDPLQNVLYRLARELFWYSGENNVQGLMWFFSESNDDNHWLYYSSKRKINKDWAIDKKLRNLIPNEFHEEDVDTIVWNFISKNGIWESSIDTPTESIDDELNLEFKNKVESLLKDELSCRTVEHKALVKNQILDFVKKHSKNWEYLELPYFLILEAKKAWLWDLQRQFFKRENNKLEICYLPSEINQTCLFDDAEKSYITTARESFTEEEQYYIDRVEEARKKIEKIRSVKSVTSFEDDLDIPIEIEHLISEKVNEREEFKQNMLMYDESVAAAYDTSERYKEFAVYFENLYKWILTSLSWFKVSNDIDTFSLFSQSLYYWNQNLFDESWNLLTIEGNKLLNDEQFKKFYDEQIKTLKIWSKTIKELWESDNSDEKELAKQASNAIYTTVLETCLINIDSSWNVLWISIWSSIYYESSNWNYYSWVNWYNGYWSWYANTRSVMEKWQSQKERIVEDLTNRFWKMQISPFVDADKVRALLKTQEIKKLTQQQRETTDITPEIQRQIENTMENVDWRYKRGKIKFDPEKSTLKSWGKETKIIFKEDWNIDTIYLDGLDLELPIREWLRLANFKNWIKYNYWNKKVEFWRDMINRKLSWRKTFKVDWTMLLARWDLEKYCPVCESDEVMEKLTEWLNND